jgi:hypothetical protein
MDALYRSDPRRHPDPRGDRVDIGEWARPACRLRPRTGRAAPPRARRPDPIPGAGRRSLPAIIAPLKSLPGLMTAAIGVLVFTGTSARLASLFAFGVV